MKVHPLLQLVPHENLPQLPLQSPEQLELHELLHSFLHRNPEQLPLHWPTQVLAHIWEQPSPAQTFTQLFLQSALQPPLHVFSQKPLHPLPHDLPHDLLQLLPQLPEHPVSHEPEQSPEQLPEQLPPQFIGVDGVSDKPNAFWAFEILGIPENTNAPSIGRTIPAAFLKKRLRDNSSSSCLLESFSLL